MHNSFSLECRNRRGVNFIMPVIGQAYRFVPPMQAAGFQGIGESTRKTPDLLFESGVCIQISEGVTAFRGFSGGEKYTFFALPGPNAPRLIPIVEAGTSKPYLRLVK